MNAKNKQKPPMHIDAFARFTASRHRPITAYRRKPRQNINEPIGFCLDPTY